MAVAAMLAGAGFANWRWVKELNKYGRDRDSEGEGEQRVGWLPEGVSPAGVFGQLAGRLVVVLTIVLAVIYGLGAMLPPFEFDVVEYHLQSAKEYYQLGFIGFNDHNIYMNMPLGLEMHGLAAMSLVGGANVNDPGTRSLCAPVSTSMTWFSPVPKSLACRMRKTQDKSFCAASVPSKVARGDRQLSHAPQFSSGNSSLK